MTGEEDQVRIRDDLGQQWKRTFVITIILIAVQILCLTTMPRIYEGKPIDK